MEHYFTNNSNTEHNIKEINFYINEKHLIFKTDNAVFSKNGIDFGSNLLVRTFLENNTNSNKKLLDMGCGYGTLGVTIGTFLDEINITMCDINERAINLCKDNSKNLKTVPTIFQSDLFENVTEFYDYVVTNPPIRTGKQTIFNIYENSYKHLNKNGELYVVIQKKQGAESSTKKMKELFGNCEVIAKKSGYQILRSIKN